MQEIVLKLENVKKYYGDIRGIEKISLELQKQTAYGFIGPNGAGKSTTLKAIMNLVNIDEGRIYFENECLDMKNPKHKEKIGYLPSDIHLYNDLTVKEMLDFHESFYNFNVKPRRKELVKKLKLDEERKIEDLSLGNLKKVGIVLAMMHSPKLLILDEPTSGLDPIMQRTFFELLEKEKESGTTILYSTHILNEVTKICDVIGFIKDGKIIKEDRVDNIIKNNITYLTVKTDEVEKMKKDLNLKVIEECNNEVKFLCTLSANEIIKKLKNYNLDKILVEQATIEDLFIEYYR